MRPRTQSRTARAASVVALAVALAACGSTTVTPADGLSSSTPAALQGTGTAAAVDGMTQFAIDFHRVAAQPGKNTVFSPLSIAYAFAMLRAGARGATADQLDATFGLPSDVHAALAELRAKFVTGETPPVKKDPPKGERPPPESDILTIANGLFTLPGYELLPDFRRTVTTEYRGEASEVNFRDTTAAARIVNAWIDKHTAGRIPDMVTPDQIPSDAVIALANAVYFRGSWEQRLGEMGDLDFAVGGKPVNIPAMGSNYTYGYASGDGWHAVELPYFDSTLVMRLIVPTGAKTPANLLIPEVLAAAAETNPQLVDLKMPRWDFETRADLVELLPKLGLTLPFSDQADLSGISGDALYIATALHAANITVDELGTEAAAATIMFGVPLSGGGPVPVRFDVDRPFVFEIVDTKTNAPVFLGTVEDPRQK